MKLLKRIDVFFPGSVSERKKDDLYIEALQNMTTILDSYSDVSCFSSEYQDKNGYDIFVKNREFSASATMDEKSYSILIYSNRKILNLLRKIRTYGIVENFLELSRVGDNYFAYQIS